MINPQNFCNLEPSYLHYMHLLLYTFSSSRHFPDSNVVMFHRTNRNFWKMYIRPLQTHRRLNHQQKRKKQTCLKQPRRALRTARFSPLSQSTGHDSSRKLFHLCRVILTSCKSHRSIWNVSLKIIYVWFLLCKYCAHESKLPSKHSSSAFFTFIRCIVYINQWVKPAHIGSLTLQAKKIPFNILFV